MTAEWKSQYEIFDILHWQITQQWNQYVFNLHVLEFWNWKKMSKNIGWDHDNPIQNMQEVLNLWEHFCQEYLLLLWTILFFNNEYLSNA